MTPVLQALVLAERIYETRDGRKIIAGTFNRIRVSQAPPPSVVPPPGTKMVLGGTDVGCPSLYISLTDVVDGTEIEIQYVNVSTNKIKFQTGLKLKPKSRLDTVELIAPLPPMSSLAAKPGTYTMDVVWRGEILGSHRIVVEYQHDDPLAVEPNHDD